MGEMNDIIETIHSVAALIKKQDQQIKDLTEKLEQAREREILAFYWGQYSPYYEFADYENSEDYLQPKP